MLMFEFRFYFFILFSTLLFFGQARLFVWIPSNQLSQSENWIGEKAPCEGDNAVIGMDESADQGIELAVLEEKLGINQLVLPENGILYFGHSAELGDKSEGWQCPKRESQDVLFRPKIIAPNFFDYANWRIDKKDDDDSDSLLEEGFMILDAEQVPSSQDSVHIDNVSKIGCDVPAKLRNFSLFGQSLSTKQIHEITLTIEGQFMFRIGSKLGADFQLNDQYQFRWPTEQVFIIGTDNTENKIPKSALFGRPNSNFFEPQFSKLCQFVRCQPINKYCTQPIKPVGHCCEKCGAMMKFQQNSLNFTHSKKIVQEYAKLAILRKLIPVGTGISFVRIDNNELNPHYQLTIIGSASVFSESEFSSTLWNAFRKIQQRGINAHLPMDYQPTKGQDYYGLKVECSLQNGFRLDEFLHWLLFFSAIGAILCFAFRNEYRRNPRLRIFVTNIWRRATTTPVVRWRRERSERVLIDGIGEETNHTAGGFLFEFVNRAFSRSNKPNNNEAEFAETISKEETLPEEKNDGNNE